MNRQELLNRISINPQICFGKPCIKGHRIWVSLILDFLASGMMIPEILEEYPQLELQGILACIAYGAEMSRERFDKTRRKYWPEGARLTHRSGA